MVLHAIIQWVLWWWNYIKNEIKYFHYKQKKVVVINSIFSHLFEPMWCDYYTSYIKFTRFVLGKIIQSDNKEKISITWQIYFSWNYKWRNDRAWCFWEDRRGGVRVRCGVSTSCERSLCGGLLGWERLASWPRDGSAPASLRDCCIAASTSEAERSEVPGAVGPAQMTSHGATADVHVAPPWTSAIDEAAEDDNSAPVLRGTMAAKLEEANNLGSRIKLREVEARVQDGSETVDEIGREVLLNIFRRVTSKIPLKAVGFKRKISD